MDGSFLTSGLAITLVGLCLGPIVHHLSRRRQELYGFLDGFVLVGVAGLILAEVLPETVSAAGLWAVFFAALGFVLPFLLERKLSLLPFSPNVFFRWLMIVGLLLHQTLDGIALSETLLGQTGDWLRVAVVLHQIPKGFFIWAMVDAARKPKLGFWVIGLLCAATIAGSLLGDRLGTVLDAFPLWLFQAFIAGGLLHVIVHHAPNAPGMAEAAADSPKQFALWSGLGAITSLGTLWALAPKWEAADPRHHEAGAGFVDRFVNLTVESAPPILLGFVAAGVVQAFIPRFVFAWMGVRDRVSQALRGILIGLPLPICSCGVVPVYLGLLRKGVPPAAAIAFLIATPEIGIDAFFLSAKLLGTQITLIRLAMAFLVALGVALTLARLFERIRVEETFTDILHPAEKPQPTTLRGKLLGALQFSTVELISHTGAWLLAGLAIAALIAPYATPETLGSIPRGVDILILSAIGMPLYICASAATPLAAVLLAGGISPGAVLALLITGPATNVTTFGILRRCHGLKGAVLFAASILGFSIACGLLVNALLPSGQVAVALPLQANTERSAVEWASAGALAVLFAIALLRLGPRGFLGQLTQGLETHAQCGHACDEHGHGHTHEHRHGHESVE